MLTEHSEARTEDQDPSSLPPIFRRIPSVSHISQDPPSDINRQTVFEWLRECIADHLDCRPPEGTKKLPKRLGDVGDLSHTGIKLISATAGHNYVTLSHCWGTENPFVATKATEATLRSHIRWKDLPLSFQDAIRVTRWLGQRYIWIDSICIVQDDDKDWDEESAKMADIYSGCELTIAASRAAGCREGSLQHRPGPIGGVAVMFYLAP